MAIPLLCLTTFANGTFVQGLKIDKVRFTDEGHLVLLLFVDVLHKFR